MIDIKNILLKIVRGFPFYVKLFLFRKNFQVNFTRCNLTRILHAIIITDFISNEIKKKISNAHTYLILLKSSKGKINAPVNCFFLSTYLLSYAY